MQHLIRRIPNPAMTGFNNAYRLLLALLVILSASLAQVTCAAATAVSGAGPAGVAFTDTAIAASQQSMTPLITLRRDIERFLREQTRNLPGEVSFQIQLSESTVLPDCTEFSVSAQASSRVVGRSTVVVRCPASAGTWSILVPIQVQAITSYVVASRQIPAGQVVTGDDLSSRTGDLGLLPPGVITQPELAIGLTARSALGAGQPVRREMLKAREVITSGQNVKVISVGSGFEVSNAGTALNAGAVGSTIRVRLATGQVVVGVATSSGAVRLSF